MTRDTCDRSTAIIIAVVTQILFFQEIPNSLAIGGLSLVTLAVVAQALQKIDCSHCSFIKRECHDQSEAMKC